MMEIRTTADAYPRWAILLIGIAHILFAVLLFYFLFQVWPPTPWPTNADSIPLKIFTWRFYATLDQRLILLVIIAGALGSYIHTARSFGDYVGNRKFVTSWTWWYMLRWFVGIALALVVYFSIRAGFMTGGDAGSGMNPYGVATLAGLAGLFSKQAADKLEEVFSVAFKPAPGKGDAQRGDKLVPPTITAFTPVEGPASGGTEVTITGTGFVDKPTAKFGDTSATVVFVDATTLKAISPPHEPGTVSLVLVNPDGKEIIATAQFTYTAPGDAQTNSTGSAASESVDDIDGCDVDIIDETPDQDLPMAEGGVA